MCIQTIKRLSLLSTICPSAAYKITIPGKEYSLRQICPPDSGLILHDASLYLFAMQLYILRLTNCANVQIFRRSSTTDQTSLMSIMIQGVVVRKTNTLILQLGCSVSFGWLPNIDLNKTNLIVFPCAQSVSCKWVTYSV